MVVLESPSCLQNFIKVIGQGGVSQGNLFSDKTVVFYNNLMIYVVCLEGRLEGNKTKIMQHS